MTTIKSTNHPKNIRPLTQKELSEVSGGILPAIGAVKAIGAAIIAGGCATMPFKPDNYDR